MSCSAGDGADGLGAGTRADGAGGTSAVGVGSSEVEDPGRLQASEAASSSGQHLVHGSCRGTPLVRLAVGKADWGPPP
jgi:hypothetical protein